MGPVSGGVGQAVGHAQHHVGDVSLFIEVQDTEAVSYTHLTLPTTERV